MIYRLDFIIGGYSVNQAGFVEMMIKKIKQLFLLFGQLLELCQFAPVCLLFFF